jgi:putative protease
MCAQPCRWNYSLYGEIREEKRPDLVIPLEEHGGETFVMASRDTCMIEHIPQLMEAGIDSFKIEGRMKSPEYVRDVTKRWRELVDAYRNANKNDMEYFAGVFGRGGHTDAYYIRKIDSKMLGVRSEADKKESASLAPFENITRKTPIELFATVKRDMPISLTAKVGEREATVYGAIPDEARTAPISEDTLRRNLSKLGDTVYCLKNLTVELDEGLILPISAINALRRAVIAELAPKSERKEEDILSAQISLPLQKREKMRSAVFFNPKNIPDEAKDFFNIIYVPLEKYESVPNNGYGVMLPEVIFDSEWEDVESLLKNAYLLGARDALVGNVGHIDRVKKYGFTVHGDLRLNVFNNSSAAYLEQIGIEDFVLSPELTLRQIRDIGGKSSTCVYGRLPLMITEKCVGRELGSCEACENGALKLTDRRGVEFPVLKRYKHRSVIFNSIPTYMADKRSELISSSIISEHFIFTVESKSEAKNVIDAYKRSKPFDGACRRIK